MGRTYRAYVPEQDFLLPPSLGDWLPEDHLAYFVADVVEQLDLRCFRSGCGADFLHHPAGLSRPLGSWLLDRFLLNKT